MGRTIPAAALFMVGFSAAILAADNWPQWRGPELNGLSKEVGVVRTWSATTNIDWKLPTPSRTGSTPIVWGNTIFLNVATAEFTGDLESPDAYTTPTVVRRGGAAEIVITGGDVATGHGPATGKEIWRVGGLNPQNAPNYRLVASPVAWQGIVIAPTRVEPMLALDVASRGGEAPKPLWSFDQGPDIPTPVTDGSLLYIVRDNGVAFALTLKTGAVVAWPPAPTAPRRCSPTATSTSRTRKDSPRCTRPVPSSSSSRRTRSTTIASARSRFRKDRSS